ncbi:MAG: hypothetical protein F4008_02585 [Gammaproteobacteria bacterium]|nr:hypothetical protein [Gammaproteobacteria bacterium]MYL12622.1 hypothetical protein [Gammaproteobacteria bacterium]
MALIDPAEFFIKQASSIEGTLMPSLNSIDLTPQVHLDYQCRFGNFNVNPAEFFHLNSKLVRGSTRKIAANPEHVNSVIQSYIETSYNPAPESVDDMDASPIVAFELWRQQVPEYLHGLGQHSVERYYAFDTLVLTGNTLNKVLPGKSILWTDRLLTEAQLTAFNNALYGVAAEALSQSSSVLMIVGCPWRYMMMYGPRGYRKMLIDIGFVLSALNPAFEDGKAMMIDHFYDNEIDRILGLDGIERSIQTIIICADKALDVVDSATSEDKK